MKKRNLLILTDGFPEIRKNRYNCQFVFDYANLISDYFDKVYVISPQPYFPKILSKFKIFKNCQRFSNFSNYQHKNIFVFYPVFYTLPFNFLRKANYLFFEKVIRKCILKNNLKFSLIHAHFLASTGLAAVKIKDIFNSKLVLTLHGGDAYNWPYKNKSNFRKAKKTLRSVDTILVPSEFMRDHVLKIEKSTRNKCSVFHNFTNLDQFDISDKKENRKQLDLPLESKILLNVSNLIKTKGHLDLLNIFNEVYSKIDSAIDLRLVIIGHGNLEEDLKREAAKLEISDKIIFTGPISNIKLPRWYNAADLFVFPSYQESFGIVQIEAMACGLPVLAYANKGSKEVFQYNNDKLIPVGNKKALAKAIIEHLREDENEEDKKTRRKYIQDFFSRESAREKLINIYERLL